MLCIRTGFWDRVLRKGVGPNAINLREILVLSNPYGFPAGVAAAMLF